MFGVGAVLFTATAHGAKAIRGVDDSVNSGIASALLGVCAGASHRSPKKMVMFGVMSGVIGAFADFGYRQTISRPENPSQLHSTLDYARFDKKEEH